MKNVLCLIAGLSLMGSFCSGCSQEKKEPVKTTVESTTSQQSDENWEPEMIKNESDDHGHEHGPGGHSH